MVAAVKFLSPNYTVNIWCVMNQRSSISRGLIIILLFAGCSLLTHFFNTQAQSGTQDVIRPKTSSTQFYYMFKTANTILKSESSWVIKVMQYHNQKYASCWVNKETNHSYKPFRMKRVKETWCNQDHKEQMALHTLNKAQM